MIFYSSICEYHIEHLQFLPLFCILLYIPTLLLENISNRESSQSYTENFFFSRDVGSVL
jgi:hypothetical protein